MRASFELPSRTNSRSGVSAFEHASALLGPSFLHASAFIGTTTLRRRPE
jgi:hypothetical protein